MIPSRFRAILSVIPGLLISCFAFSCIDEPPHHAEGGRTGTDSLSEVYLQALSHLTSPKLEERKRVLRSFQQKGYASTLKCMLDNDGLSALISSLKTNLQIEYSVSHEPVLVDITHIPDNPPAGAAVDSLDRRRINLPAVPRQPAYTMVDIDWTFPEDPWKKE